MEPNADPNCVFCKIVAGELSSAKVLETDEALAIMDVGPLAPGHVLLIPKRHVAKLDDMTTSQAGAVLRHLPAIGKAVRHATGCSGYNVLQNNGRVAHQEVMHVHFHIIPRNPDDAFHFNWPVGKYAAGELDAMQEKIRSALES
ncbi:MAG: HIT family protein [Planctomycetes bacterium]|nr:HIT family protein [Planctomycetota bacterium]